MRRTLAEFKTGWNDAIKKYIFPYKAEYILGSIFVIIILWSEMYYDFWATYRNGINFWYALFEGHPLSFYSYAGAIQGATPNRVMICDAAYDFTIYLFFAVWNFPAWLYERISGNYAESCFVLVAWGKLMMPVIAVIVAGGMKKILEFITRNDNDTANMIYAYLFSGILIMAAYFIGQYDIIGVMFAVYGLYYYLKEDYKKFYLFFGIAITCKYFALFLFICLVLLYEKRLVYIVRDIVAGCWLVLLEKVIFSLGKSYESIHPSMVAENLNDTVSIVGTNLLSDRITYLFHLKMPMGVDVMSVFVFLIGLIWTWCYLIKREEKYSFYYRVIYIAFCINTVFTLFTASTPYWAILIVPYMFLMIYCRGTNRKLNILLETVGISCFIIWHFAREPYFFSSKNCEGMLFYYLLGQPFYFEEGFSVALSKIAESGAVSSIISMIRSVFYACLLIMLVVNFPKREDNYISEKQEPGMRGLLLLRMVCMIGLLLIPVIVYVIQVLFNGTLCQIETSNQVMNEIVELLRS